MENTIVESNMPFVRHFPGKSANKFADWIEEHKEFKFTKPDNISLLSVITKECQDSSCLAHQCKINEINLVNPLNDRFVRWNRYDKAKYVLEGLNNIDTEYTLVLDGNDTLIINNLDDLVDKFNSFNCKVLFNATCYNYPKMIIDDIVRRYMGRYRYINAGVCFGKTEDLKWLYELVICEIEKDFHHVDSEQYYVRKAFEKVYQYISETDVKFDHENLLFECMHMR